MSKSSEVINPVVFDVQTHTTSLFLIFLAVVQIAGCVVLSGLIGAPLDHDDPHYWVDAFNHVLSILMIAVVLFVWVSPLKKNIGIMSEKLKRSRQKNSEIAHVLRGHIGWQFESWGLTSAERDVAMLSLKGIKISEIAAYRNSREGTIKAHLNSIFRKAGVSSRVEFLATCLESFIDLGSAQEDDKPMTASGPVS